MAEALGSSTDYDHFGPQFYEKWKNSPGVMAKVKEINDMYDTYIYVFGVEQPEYLDQETQEYLNRRSKLVFSLGDGNE